MLAAALIAPSLIACAPPSTPTTLTSADHTSKAVRGDAPRDAVGVTRTHGDRQLAPVAQPSRAGTPTSAAPTTQQSRKAPARAPRPAPTPSTATSSAATASPSASAPPTPATPSAVPPLTASGGSLAGHTFYGPNEKAVRAAESLQSSRPDDAKTISDIALVPTAMWLGAWAPDATAVVRQRVADARAAGGIPVFVVYNVPDLDCGGLSAVNGGQTAAGYEPWIKSVAAGIGSDEAVVVVEPDTLAQVCGDPEARFALLRTAVSVLEANPGTHTYLDAGNSGWIDAATMAERLRSAGVDEADGFSLNVANFHTTASNVAYGTAVSAALGGAHFVIDTGRNGNGFGDTWCNPAGRALGQRPTTQTGNPLVDAFLWVKPPGDSDGTCNGGPTAGVFWVDYALGLARN